VPAGKHVASHLVSFLSLLVKTPNAGGAAHRRLACLVRLKAIRGATGELSSPSSGRSPLSTGLMD
jgi:hypothetical protein